MSDIMGELRRSVREQARSAAELPGLRGGAVLTGAASLVTLAGAGPS